MIMTLEWTQQRSDICKDVGTRTALHVIKAGINYNSEIKIKQSNAVRDDCVHLLSLWALLHLLGNICVSSGRQGVRVTPSPPQSPCCCQGSHSRAILVHCCNGDASVLTHSDTAAKAPSKHLFTRMWQFGQPTRGPRCNPSHNTCIITKSNLLVN